MRPKGVSPLLNKIVDVWLGIQDLLDSKIIPKGYLAVCALFRDEAEYLEEWIEYHRMVGVEHFFLYNHQSKDNYRRILQPYISSGLVTLRDLSFSNPWERWQVKAYFHAQQKCIRKFKWLAAIDTDEFFCPVKDNSITSILRRLENHAAVFVYWKMFGTSGKELMQSGDLQTEIFTQCAPDDFSDHVLGKTIAQPERIIRFKIHEAVLKEGENSALPNGSPVGGTRDYSILQLNHYWTRTEEYFNKRKKTRRRIAESNDGSEGRSNEELACFSSLLNSKQDYTMQKYVPELRCCLQRKHDTSQV